MKSKHILLGSLLSMFFLSTSCTNDDKPSDIIKYTVPSTYTFTRGNTTTVSFQGQTDRILMLEEMGVYINKPANWPLNSSKLMNMYSNQNGEFINASLNVSTKQLRSKTAASVDYFVNYKGGGSVSEQAAVRLFFENSLQSAVLASQNTGTNTAQPGVAGQADGNRLFAANGLEPQQVLLKGLMGACFMDQISNNYLSLSVLDEGNNRADNTNKVLVQGTNYTNMEHKWDEAYGYVYGADGTKFWSSYINQVNADNDFKTVKAEIDLAFRKGRAAITGNDYNVRNQQIAIIRQKLALVAAVRAVFYLQDGKSKLLPDVTKAFHGLTEAYGFIMSLRYTQNPNTNNPYFSKSEIDTMLASLLAGQNGFWDINHLNVKLDEISVQIASKFGFTVAQAAVVN